MKNREKGKHIMAIIKPKDELASIKLKIPAQVFHQVQAYCKWANIEDDFSHFFAQAAEFLFQKDKEWRQYLDNKSENTSNS